jgi:predicted amidophosphoribosyltransferase
MSPCAKCGWHLMGFDKNGPPCNNCALPIQYAESIHVDYWRSPNVFDKYATPRKTVSALNGGVTVLDGRILCH